MRKRGSLWVLSGPSGAGKGTLRRILFERLDNLVFSISCTTRKRREGEKDGVDYRFIDEPTFLSLVEQGKFLEWAKVHGNYYGTLREDVEKALDEGKDVVLEIDVQGALQVKQKLPETITIFVLPPSMEELRHRLESRGTEAEPDLSLRLQNAQNELSCAKEYDFCVVNDDLKRAADELVSYMLERRREKDC